MRRYLFKMYFLITIVIFILTGCSVSDNGKNNKMPLIVFQCGYANVLYNYPESRSIWTIDNMGNMYYFNGGYSFEHEAGEDLIMVYESMKQDKYARYIGTIDKSILEEKYNFFLEILNDGHYEKDISGYDERGLITDCQYCGTQWWGAYAYDKDYNVKYINLHTVGDFYYTSEDSRMKELADWINELFKEDIEESKGRCAKMKMEALAEEKRLYEESLKK